MTRGGSASTVKVKHEKVSGRSKGKRKAYDDDADTEGEQVPAEDEDQDTQGELDQEGDGGTAKRARLNEGGDFRPGDKGKQKEPKERVKTLPRDVDG